jgi:hypothetical protein
MMAQTWRTDWLTTADLQGRVDERVLAAMKSPYVGLDNKPCWPADEVDDLIGVTDRELQRGDWR